MVFYLDATFGDTENYCKVLKPIKSRLFALFLIGCDKCGSCQIYSFVKLVIR